MVMFAVVAESAKVQETQKEKEVANAITIIKAYFVMNAKIMIFIWKQKPQIPNSHFVFDAIQPAR